MPSCRHLQYTRGLSRFSRALGTALVLHLCGALLCLWAPPGARPTFHGTPSALEIDVSTWESESETPPSAVDLSKLAAAASGASTLARSASPRLLPSPSASSEPGDSADTTQATASALSPPEEARALSPGPRTRPINLGLGSGIFEFETHDRATTESAPARTGTSTSNMELNARATSELRTGMAAPDVERGLARGSAWVTIVASLARALGPSEGDALLRITLDAFGEVSSVELIGGSPPVWQEVLRALRKHPRARGVIIPPESHGLQLTLAVNARIRRASGGKGSGLVFPGIVFDVSDLAGVSARSVNARIVSEDLL